METIFEEYGLSIRANGNDTVILANTHSQIEMSAETFEKVANRAVEIQENEGLVANEGGILISVEYASLPEKRRKKIGDPMWQYVTEHGTVVILSTPMGSDEVFMNPEDMQSVAGSL